MPGGKAYDQAYIRRRNSLQLLEVLTACQGLSRTDLTHITGMSATSVGRIVGALMELGLVEESASAAGAGRGRRAVRLRTCPDGLYTLGIHLDTQAVTLRAVSFDGKQAASLSAPAPRQLTPQSFARCAREMWARLPRKVVADPSRVRMAGVCLSGTVNRRAGRVARSDQMDWTDAPLGEVFSQALGMPALVENDVKSSLMGEKALQGLAPEEDCAYLFIGQAGIGTAMIVNHRLVRGRDDASGEIDGIPLVGNDVMQKHLLGKNLVARAQAVSPGVRDVEDILSAYRLDVRWARMLVEDYANHLALLLRMIDSLLRPHRIILGGKTIMDFAWLVPRLSVERLSLGGDFAASCAHGAAVIALEEATQRLLKEALKG